MDATVGVIYAICLVCMVLAAYNLGQAEGIVSCTNEFDDTFNEQERLVYMVLLDNLYLVREHDEILGIEHPDDTEIEQRLIELIKGCEREHQ